MSLDPNDRLAEVQASAFQHRRVIRAVRIAAPNVEAAARRQYAGGIVEPSRQQTIEFHSPTKTISPAQIKQEVAKAEKHPSPIERYVIATTAKKAGRAQDAIAELNRRSDKKFTVEIHFWEEIRQYANEQGEVSAELIIYGRRSLAGAAEPNQLSLIQPHPLSKDRGPLQPESAVP